MKLSGWAFASILLCSTLFSSNVVFAQHSSGGGGGSHGGSSGGSFASSSSFASGHSTSTMHATATNSHSVATTKISSVKTPAQPVRKILSNAMARKQFSCTTGENCRCVAGGTRNGFGGCTPAPIMASCSYGYWNGYSCGGEAFFNDCRQLADQVSLQGRQWNRNGIREGLRYHMLVDEYDYCQHAFHGTLPWLDEVD